MSMNYTPTAANGIRRSLLDYGPSDPRLPQKNIEDSEELRSVPFADCSYELNVLPPFFSESNLAESRSLFNEKPRNDIESNTAADAFNDQAGSSHEELYADRVNVGTNAWDGRSSDVRDHAFHGAHRTARRTAPVNFGRNDAIYQQRIPLVKRRQWNDPPTPPLDTWLPEFLQKEEAVNEHQHELEYMDVCEYPSVPEDGFYPNVDKQHDTPTSNFLFISTVQYVSNRVVKFQVHDDFFTGRINIASFQHRQIYVWNDERFMEFSMEIFVNNETDEIQYCNSGTIQFPYLIRRETFACWYDPYKPFLCFRAMYL